MTIRASVLISLLSFGFGEFTSALGAPSTQPAPAMETVARIHWIGNAAITTNTAPGFMRVWNMPESRKLREQILDKLSAAPWSFIRGQSNASSTNLLHPLLQDLLDNEFYLEIDQPAKSTNRPGELVLAIRLTDSRDRLWKTNVAAALESLTPLHVADSSPGRRFLKKDHVPNLIEIARAGQWTLLGAAQDNNTLLDRTIARIQSGSPPFLARDTNSWLEADVHLARSTAAMGHALRLPPNFPAFSLTIAAARDVVRTHGEFYFPRSVPLRLEPWKIPANLIGTDFADFTAIRGGTPPFLSKFWSQFDTNPPPDQFFLWSLVGPPMETYVAAPLADASNAVSRLSDLILRRSASWFSTNDLIAFEKAKGSNVLKWTGIPYISPSLQSVETPAGPFVLAGFFTPMAPDKPFPAELRQGLQSRTNLIYYSQELTGMKVQQLTFLSQLARLVMSKPQLQPKSPALLWLKALGQNLGQSHTEIFCDRPRQLTLERGGTTPFTALELQLLAAWVESPQFPAPGLFSLESH